MSNLKNLASATLLVLLAAPPAFADLISFSFEGEVATYSDPPGGARPGALTSLPITVAGLTITITRPGSAFDIVSNTGSQGFKPASWGVRSLDPFFAETSATPFVINFSQPITSFSVEFGDYGADTPDILALDAFSGPGATGTLLSSSSASFPGAFPTFSTGSVSAAGINSIRMIGGTPSFPHSVFYDNLTVNTVATVPEPSAMVLLGVGVLGLSLYRRIAGASPVPQQRY